MEYAVQTMENFQAMAQDRKIILFGAGEFAMRFMNSIGRCIQNIAYIVDNNPEKVGGALYGIQILSPESLSKEDPSRIIVVIVTTTGIASIYRQIRGMDNFVIFSGRILLNEVFCTVARELHEGSREIQKVEALLYDDMSKKIYRETIKRRMIYGEEDFSDLIIGGDAEYRIPLMYEKKPPENEVIVDAGAYIGDTLKKFVNTFGTSLKKVYCIECEEENLDDLERTISFLRRKDDAPEMEVFPYALSDHRGTMTFAKTHRHTGGFLLENRKFAIKTRYESEYVDIRTETLDHLIMNEKVTLIKMDIEGSEYEALKGAERIIRQYKPRLAISIYHIGKDYYRIPLLVKEYVPEYKLAIRHHNRNHCDTDMYCWV